MTEHERLHLEDVLWQCIGVNIEALDGKIDKKVLAEWDAENAEEDRINKREEAIHLAQELRRKAHEKCESEVKAADAAEEGKRAEKRKSGHEEWGLEVKPKL